MEKKKLKLSISGSSKKTFSSIEQARSHSKNTVVIEKKNSKFSGKSQFSRQKSENFRTNKNISSKTQNFNRPNTPLSSDFEKRKLAEQRATRRLKGEVSPKENKLNKIGLMRSQKPMSTSFLASKMIFLAQKKCNKKSTTLEAKALFELR